MQGYIAKYESFATMEGPGIRFAVFLSGCNLRCVCCHNPDSWRQGNPVDSEDLVRQILRYKPYFRSGGGVTFSGGEPLMQTDFVIEVSRMLKAEGIHIVLDTACSLLETGQKELYDLCDLVIADLKFPDAEGYERYCKNGVFDTVIKTFEYLDMKQIPVWVRTVIIPGINDTKEMIARYAAIIKKYSTIQKYELKPFHTMGFSKYEQLGIENPLADTAALSPDRLGQLKQDLNEIMNKNPNQVRSFLVNKRQG
jgi:pyruvate formate lyase activating enzyme